VSTATESTEFARRTEPFRRELLAHCYRMLGSVDDAEDLVQETYLRAWRGYGGFEDRASIRVWLDRIATNACLTALERRGRRALPSGLDAFGDEPPTAWLQPLPDALVTGPSDDPEAIVVSRDSLRLALVASLQYLPPRQRAVLILRDVLAWPADAVAELLDTTTAAVKSALQRARARLEEAAPAADALVEPTEPGQRALLARYIAGFESADAAALKRLLREDAALEVVPSTIWSAGRDACMRVIADSLGAPGDWRMLPTAANGQPAAAAYLRGEPFGVAVLTATGTGIARIVVFADAALVERFPRPVPSSGR
jgi:RNA polymerase sigma-70 factor (ECF subfamily)